MATDDQPTTESSEQAGLVARRGWRNAVAGALLDAARRLTPKQVAHSYALPEQVTGVTAQQARLNQQLTARQHAAWNASVGSARRRQPKQSAAQQALSPLAQTTDALNAGGLNAGTLDSAMQTNQAPQDTAATMYAPGAPLPVSPGLVPPSEPRQFEYPISYNVTPQPRTTELTSFAQLRALAFAYEGIRLCEQVYFDIIAGLELKVGFKPNIIPDGESVNDPKWRKIAAPAEAFLQRPDGVTPLNVWMTAGIRDVLEVGCAYLYRRRDRAGRVQALDFVDAATLKPLLDERGRMPLPPYPAFEQYLYGIPAYYLRADEVDWIRETARTDSPYPTSRVEYVITRINQALRKQLLDLARYTDGAVPEGVFPPADGLNMSVEQVEEAERLWNGLLAGNDAMKTRVKFAPWPGTFTQTRDMSPVVEFDRFLLNVTVAAFGLTMDELGITDTSNKSVGASQEDVVYRRAVKPVASLFAHALTNVAQREFDPRLVVGWTGYEEEEDQLQKANTLNVGVQNGSLSPSRMARMMGWPVDLEIPPMIVTQSGPIWLEDAMNLRQAQKDAQVKGLQFAIGAPGSAQTPGLPAASAGGSAPPPTPPVQPVEKPAEPPAKADMTPPPAPGKTATPTVKASAAKAAQPTTRPVDVTPAIPEDIRAEWRAWYTRATRAAKAGAVGASLPPFERRVIPPEDYALCAADLAEARNLADVKAAFTRAREREALPLHSVPAGTPAVQPLRTLTPDEARALEARNAVHRAGVTHARDDLALRARDIFEQVAREGYHASQGYAHGG